MKYAFVSGWKRSTGNGGLMQYSIDEKTGEIKLVRSFLEEESLNVSYLDKKNNLLIVVNETPNLRGLRFGGGGGAYIMHLDPQTGEASEGEYVPLMCACPADLGPSKDNAYYLVAGHGARGYATVVNKDAFGEYQLSVITDDTPVMLFERKENGEIGKLLDVVKHQGSGPFPKQMTAHPHTVAPSPLYDMYAVCDKGSDKIYMYCIDSENNRLVQCGKPFNMGSGEAPRYCQFHPTQPYFYCNSETGTYVYAFSYDENGLQQMIGKYNSVGNQSIPEGAKMIEGQGLLFHPSGKYLYNVVHGSDSVGVFRVNDADGSLELIQDFGVGCAWPRGIAITPDGKYMLISCVDGKKVLVFSLNDDGTLENTGYTCDQDNASFITIWDTGLENMQ